MDSEGPPPTLFDAILRLGRRIHAWVFPEPGEFRYKATSFLCDSCKFNHDRYCSRPDRPNATKCPDYKK